jgi:2-methylcitrate dehydratase PrpD
MTIERQLASWAAETSASHTDVARMLARDALVDITACIIGGAEDPATRAVLEVARRMGNGAALALGSDVRLAAPWAALVGGTAAHALDFDDNFAPAVTHATAVLAPALFALADEERASGAQIIDAYIVGLEIQARIGDWANPQHYERGWHATSTIGVIGTAAGCARLLGLDAERTLAAMSIAFSMACGSKKQFGSMMKPIHAGLAAKSAVLAARMAQADITGNVEPLGGRWGFVDLYGAPGSHDQIRRELLASLGSTLAIETHGLLPKRFPCCGAAHRTLDGLLELRRQHGFAPESVDHVDVFIPSFARANLRFDQPENEMEARFSLTYCAARVLDSGRLTLSDLTIQRVSDSRIRPLLGLFRIHTKEGSVCEELGEHATPAVTRVVLKTGEIHEIGIRAAKGSRAAPFTDAEKFEKFLECCHWAGREPRAEALFELAQSIGHLERFSEFTAALADEWRPS